MGWPNFCSFLISSIFKSSSLFHHDLKTQAPGEIHGFRLRPNSPHSFPRHILLLWFLISLILSLSSFSISPHTSTGFLSLSGCYGQVPFPGQLVENVLRAIQIYIACNEAYRLNPSGHVNEIPNDARLFCNGPCLEETQLVLDCIDRIVENYLFRNGASVQNVRNAIKETCRYANQEGNFIGGWLWEGERSRADVLLLKSNILYAFMPFGWFLVLI